MYTEATAINDLRPAVYPAEAGKVMVSDGTAEVTADQIAVDALVGVSILPAGCVPIDFTLIEDDLDTGTALVQAVGVLNSTEDGLVASTNLLTGSTIGRAGGSARATAMPDALITPSDSDRIIAVKTTTGGVLAVQATNTVTSSGVNVTADDTVTVNGKAYKFVAAPAVEGDVDIGATAEETLSNLLNAINHAGELEVDHFCAAAHPTVMAVSSNATVLNLRALAFGAGGNALTLAKSAVTLTVGGGTFSGGVTAVPLKDGTIRGILTYRSGEYGA